MSELASAGDVQSFTSWKFDILDAMMSDPRVTDAHFRVAFRVMQAMSQANRVAIIGDAVLADEVPRCDRFRANDARKRLTELAWWTVERGHGGQASRYRFSDANVNGILDRRIIDREARREKRAQEKVAYRQSAREERGYVVTQPRPMTEGDVVTAPRPIESRDVVQEPRGDVVELPRPTGGDVVQRPHKAVGGRGPGTTGDVVELPPVHLQSPSEDPLPLEGRATRTPAGAHPPMPAREAMSSPIVIPPGQDAVLDLMTRVGKGSWTAGAALLDNIADGDMWRQKARHHGITAADLTAIST